MITKQNADQIVADIQGMEFPEDHPELLAADGEILRTSLTALQNKRIAIKLGLKTTGTEAVLTQRISDELKRRQDVQLRKEEPDTNSPEDSKQEENQSQNANSKA